MNLAKAKCIYPNQHVHNYSVAYTLFTSNSMAQLTEKEIQSINGFTRGSACYSGFFRKKDSKHNKIYTELMLESTGVVLTEEEAIAWLELCQTHKLLPEYLDPKACFKTSKHGRRIAHVTFDFTDIYQARLYTYLDTFRHLREDPGFVKSILYMCNEKGMDFYIAFVLASHFNITGVGHHCLSVSKGPYGGSNNSPAPEGVDDSLNLKMVRNLFKFINDPDTVCGSKVDIAGSWNCNKLIRDISTTDYVVPIKDLDFKDVIEIAHSIDEQRATKYYKKYKDSVAVNKPKKGDKH